MKDEEINAFLAELTELTRKYNIVIRGCGCCGSPGIDRFSPGWIDDKDFDNYRYVLGPRTGGEIGFESYLKG